MIRIPFFFEMIMLFFLTGCIKEKPKQNDYPIHPVPFTAVKLTDHFWAPRIRQNHNITIPIALYQSTITGRIENFKIAGGIDQGSFCSKYPFDDSDVYKIIEGASYSLQTIPDPDLEAKIDSLIGYIGAAQEDDGYLYTYRTIMGNNSHPWIGSKRWEKTNILSHELYNLGHMYEAAVAYYQATGKRKFLDIAIKSANLVDHDFGWGKIENYPGHQEIEIGLVKLYRVTGDKRYLDLAKFFLDVRGGGERYNQADKKVIEQDSAVGHAVRAAYMYSAMADVAALTGDQDYVKAISRIWEDVVYRKLYVTGGIGSDPAIEGFGPPWYLPNESAYCETCASVANVFWNYRMFLLKGDAAYYDILERTMYNSLLSGISLSGDRFFYSNPLASHGQHKRREWFGCACCPANLTRFIPSVPGYIYATDKQKLYVNLYIANEASMEMKGHMVNIKMETNYPWEGRITLSVKENRSGRFALALRIPGWAENKPVPGNLYTFSRKESQLPVIYVNGKEAAAENSKGYLIINRKWKTGDTVSFEIPMPVRIIRANQKVEADQGHFALQHGPVVYCLEWPDQPSGKIFDLLGNPNGSFTAQFDSALLNGVEVIKTEGLELQRDAQHSESWERVTLTAIPYFAWANRGPGEMEVWIPFEKELVNQEEK
ncbi:MAG: glycoside hydrolase family 127 protein [Chlorobi bacterium]|nr:glycoside hydrolase family 127 protein [Chlorobiota bacterium]